MRKRHSHEREKLRKRKKDANGGSAPNVAPDRGQKLGTQYVCSTQNILITIESTLQHRYPNLLLLSVCQDQRALKNIHDRMAITQGSNTDRRSFIVQIFLLKNHTLNTKYTDGAAVSKTYQRVKKNYPCFFCKPLGSSFTKGKKSRPCMYGRRTSGITRPFATDGQQELRRYE